MEAINKIIEELQKSPGNRDRFNTTNMKMMLDKHGVPVFYDWEWLPYHGLNEMAKERLIRISLSRRNGQPILQCLEGKGDHHEYKFDEYLSDELYLSFDEPLRRGLSLEEAIGHLSATMKIVGLV